jgi:hypothetical protein
VKDLSIMFDVIPALAQRFSRLRAHGRVHGNLPTGTAFTQRRTSLGETMAIGLGCDSYKHRS